jgi:hypothetical protein
MNNNGLREIRDDHDTRFMCTFVDIGHHKFSIYLDHEQSLKSAQAKLFDDVVHYPVAPLPAVISPIKPGNTTHTEISGSTNVSDENAPIPLMVVQPGSEEEEHFMHSGACSTMNNKRTRRSHATEEDMHSGAVSDSGEDGDDSDFEIADSDYGISDGDDDLFGDNVADASDDDNVREPSNLGRCKNAKAKGKLKVEMKDEASEEEDLWAPDSDDEMAHHKFKTFREDDLNDPKFQVGQVFGSVELLRKAIRTYSCLKRKDIKLPINDLKRLRAVCSGENCPWYLWASLDSRTKCFMIKRFNAEHTCSGKWTVYAFTTKFIAEKFMENFRADQDMSLRNLSRIVQKGWNMTVGRSKLQRARRLAMQSIYGDEEEQYKMLWDYANEIRRSNPGSTFYLSVDECARFKKCYMSLQASKKGFLEGCRPVIFIDGCHIKTRYRGQLLTAVGMDPNDCIFPISIAAVEVEDTASWRWFLETLKSDLGIINTTPWTIMSDKQKVVRRHLFL